jgi:hypothetical protein
MDHETAIQLEAAERYALGQLSAQERDSFEEHFFLCSVCAADVRELAALKANLRAVAGIKLNDSSNQDTLSSALPGFFSKIPRGGLLTSLTLNAFLLLFAVYHFSTVDPPLRRLASTPQYLQEIPLLGVVRSDTPIREVQAGTRLLLLTGYLQNEVSAVSIEIRDQSGKVHYSDTAPAPPREPSNELHLSVVIAGLPAGDYQITVRGVQNGSPGLIGESRIRLLAQ